MSKPLGRLHKADITIERISERECVAHWHSFSIGHWSATGRTPARALEELMPTVTTELKLYDRRVRNHQKKAERDALEYDALIAQ